MQLAIDTSSDYASLAVAREGHVIGEMTWRTGQNHTTELLPVLIYLLRTVKIEPNFLSSIVVALGPGSYTGLRAGLSTAKGFAFALNIPLLGIGTLELEAYPYYPSGLPICAVHDAGRGEIATALYQWREGKWQEMEVPHLTTLSLLCQKIDEPTIFCGEVTEGMASQIRANVGNLAIVYPPSVARRRAGLLTILGWQRLREGRLNDPATLQPLYLRGPSITKPKARRHLKGEMSVQRNQPSS